MDFWSALFDSKFNTVGFRTYYHMMKFGKLTESTALTFLEYIQRNLPEGVAMKVTKYERQQFPSLIEDHIKEATVDKQSQ